MLLFGTIIVWIAIASVVGSTLAYLLAGVKTKTASQQAAWTRAGRILFIVSVASVIAVFADLGTLLVTHRFDCKYVYEHSARGMAPLYWFPSMWAGQEGSFLLWAFWTGIVGVVLAATAGPAERRVMPIYNGILIFLTAMLALRSPFLPLDTQGAPIPTEGLGLNPNLENPWMVIHPPTLFLGFAAVGVPFAYGLMALIWKDRHWMQRTLPWALFGFSFLGLAMMMGGFWAYEMLGWGGFWGWDPVENGPFIPWLCLMAFLHAAQVQRVGRGLNATTHVFALLPLIAALYETFLTRTGVLQDFSVHSFSTLGGAANNVLLGVLLGTLAVSVGLLLLRRRTFQAAASVWEAPASREFGYTLAVVVIMVCAAISTLGMSAPLITQIGVSLHGWLHGHGINAAFLPEHTSTVKEDFYNKANFPVGVLLAAGMGIGPLLAWRERGAPNTNSLMRNYMIAVAAAIVFVIGGRISGLAVSGGKLVAELVLFTASVFAVVTNGGLIAQRLRKRETAYVWTAGGVVSHLGAAVLLLGIVSLVCFTRRDNSVFLIQGIPDPVLGGAYTVTYLGQSSDFKTDHDNALRFLVKSADGKESFVARLPFALRSIEGGDKKIIGHPSIVHHLGGDLYFALKDGPDEVYKKPLYRRTIGMGQAQTVGPYKITFDHFERDRDAAAYVLQTGRMPENFPVMAVLRVEYQGKISTVVPQLIMHRDSPDAPDTPEAALPGGWLVSLQQMNAGSSDVNHPDASGGEGAQFTFREDSGPPSEAFEMDITTRPMVNLVWVGTLILVLGGLMSMRRRIAEVRALPAEAEDDAEGRSAVRSGQKRRAKLPRKILPDIAN
jgi:cytochrome c-type biogenesis protein CcmF